MREGRMGVRGVDHIDLAVSDVEASLAFYLGLLGPVGLKVEARFKTYRGTEDVFYLGFGQNVLGFTTRPKQSTTWTAITRSLPSIPTGFASRFALGPTRPASSGMPRNGHRKSRSCVVGVATTRSRGAGLGRSA